MADKLRIEYLGTNVGKIYLSDFGKRLGLGGAQEGDYYGGQDAYIIWGETLVVELTSDVLLSMSNGILAHFSDSTNTDWSTKNGAPLTLTEGAYTSADTYPRRDLGDTGGTRFSDTYIDRLADEKWAPTGASGVTGYYYGNAI
jgi:hypothetical protein